MKTTKTSLLNTIIVCSIGANLVAIGGLCYIAGINSKSERLVASLSAPVIIYAPKEQAPKSATAGLVASAVK